MTTKETGTVTTATAEKLGPNCAADTDTRCPTLPRCKLCPASPTYWRNSPGVAERAARAASAEPSTSDTTT